MRAALRRGKTEDGGAIAQHGDVIEIGDVRLDAGRHEVSVRGEQVALPLKEFELLELLLANAGRVLTRDVLIDRVWGPNYYGDTKTLDVHVKRLRAKVEDDPAHPEHGSSPCAAWATATNGSDRQPSVRPSSFS